MISFGFELLVIEMIGVIWSNCLISDVADTPSNFGITISYGINNVSLNSTDERNEGEEENELR
jgi:hypothetical protein